MLYEPINIQDVICNWCTYNGTHCRRNIALDSKNGIKFCSMHMQLYGTFSLPNIDTCEIQKDIFIVPRSYKHVKLVMKELGYEDDIVDVKTKGGIIEEANISDEECIVLLSDDTRYPYAHDPKNKNKLKDIKIILKKYCENKSSIKYNDVNYCEECYKQLKNTLKLSIALRYLQ